MDSTERVLDVRHWSERLFSIRCTRGAGLRFENGQFVMLGLEVDGRKIVRAYSIAGANYEDTLVLRDLKPGKRLIMMATGTGIAPFLSIAKDPETYERFERVILLRGARVNADLAYGDAAIRRLREDQYLGDAVRARLLDYPTVTQETGRYRGRVTTCSSPGDSSRRRKSASPETISLSAPSWKRWIRRHSSAGRSISPVPLRARFTARRRQSIEVTTGALRTRRPPI